MKKSELRKIIRESISKVLSENPIFASREDLKALSRLGFKGKINDDNWLVGNVMLRNMGTVGVNIELTEDPSSRGIKNGRILRLFIFLPRSRSGKIRWTRTLASYDSGRWGTQPEEPEVKKFVAQIIKALSEV
jgi:hypothetical protein